MYVFSALTLSVGIVAILFGLYVLNLDRRSRAHLLFFALCLSIGCWNLLGAFTLAARTQREFWWWYRAASTCLIFYISVLPHFALVLAGSSRATRLSLLSYALSATFHYVNWTAFYAFRAVERLGDHWIFVPNSGSPWFYLWILYSHGAAVLSALIIFRWGRHSFSRRVRAQARIVGWSFLGLLLVGSLGDFVASRLLGIPAVSALMFFGSAAGIAYAMVRYRFLSITHETVSRDLLQSMDAVVLLLDQERRVVMANRQAEALFGCAAGLLEGRVFGEILCPARMVDEGLRRIDGRGRDSYTFVAQVAGRPDTVTVEATISVVRDRFEDPLGIMVVAREQRRVRDFLRRFRVTAREWETIQLVLAELPNREIAEHLGVTERTVKAHIGHIYGKLGVDNKIGLFKALREYDLLGDRSHTGGANRRLLRSGR